MVTVKMVQDALGIKNKEEQIGALIPLVENFVKDYCNIDEIPEAYNRNIIKMIEYDLNRKSGVQSETLSRHSVTYSNDYPPDLLKGLRRKLRW